MSEQTGLGASGRRMRLTRLLDCSQNYGPHLATDYIMAPKIQGYQNGNPIWELSIRFRALQDFL